MSITNLYPSQEMEENGSIKPGEQLFNRRQEIGYSAEFVASKLHIRVRLIELLEADDYANMPEPVFIKGYIQAYAKLVDLDPAPLLDLFNSLFNSPQYADKKFESTFLLQSSREEHHGERLIRWVTGIFALGVMIATASWWYANKENEKFFSTRIKQTSMQADSKSETEIRLTDLSKMRSLLSSMEKE